MRCKTCGDEFTPKSKTQRFCCPSCAYDWDRIRKREEASAQVKSWGIANTFQIVDKYGPYQFAGIDADPSLTK